MVDPVRAGRVKDKEIQADMARLEMAEALRHGNVYEVMKSLPAGLTIRDFEEYMGEQYKAFKSMVQDYMIVEPEASVAEPSLVDFPMHDESASMRPGEGTEFVKGMISSFKKMTTKAETTEEAAETATTGEEAVAGAEDLAGLTQEQLDEWDSFMNDAWGQIIDNQFLADYNKKMSEVEGALRRIIAMAKAGQADPETVLIALARVNQTKNGCLMTWLGKKAFMMNESMNKISNELTAAGASDTAAIMNVQAKTRDGSFQLNLLVSDMQKVVQDSASVLEQVKGYIDELNRTRREIITKIAAH